MGMRLAMDDPGYSLNGSALFAFGMMSNPDAGVTNGPLSITTSHFWGLRNIAATIQASRTAGPPVRFGLSLAGTKKVGASLTQTSGPTHLFSGEPSTYRTFIILSLLKGTNGSGNWSIGKVYVSTVTGCIDYSRTEIENAMLAAVGQTFANGLTAMVNSINTAKGVAAASSSSLSTTMNLNESTDGALNSPVVAWERSISLLHCSEVLFLKIA